MRCNQASSTGSRRGARWWPGLCCALALAGCNAWHPATYVPPEIAFGPPLQANPAVVGVMDRDLLWDQVVDVVDDYFKIRQEDRVRLVGDLLTEGRLDTYPRSGSTIFEPWNGDSCTPYERLESTLQSIQRTALVRVVPTEAGYSIEVQVLKQLENVPRPETGTVSQTNSAALRNDNSLQRVIDPVGGQQPTLGWIDQGRDVALEQQMLAQIQDRLAACGAPRQF